MNYEKRALIREDNPMLLVPLAARLSDNGFVT